MRFPPARGATALASNLSRPSMFSCGEATAGLTLPDFYSAALPAKQQQN